MGKSALTAWTEWHAVDQLLGVSSTAHAGIGVAATGSLGMRWEDRRCATQRSGRYMQTSSGMPLE